jgi:hypothetical protein
MEFQGEKGVKRGLWLPAGEEKNPSMGYSLIPSLDI